MKSTALLLAATALALASCISVGADLAASTVPLEEGDYSVVGGLSEGTAWGVNFLYIPISEPNVTGRARDRAIAAGGGEELVNVSLSSTFYFVPFVSVFRTTVRGIPVTLDQ